MCCHHAQFAETSILEKWPTSTSYRLLCNKTYRDQCKIAPDNFPSLHGSWSKIQNRKKGVSPKGIWIMSHIKGWLKSLLQHTTVWARGFGVLLSFVWRYSYLACLVQQGSGHLYGILLLKREVKRWELNFWSWNWLRPEEIQNEPGSYSMIRYLCYKDFSGTIRRCVSVNKHRVRFTFHACGLNQTA